MGKRRDTPSRKRRAARGRASPRRENGVLEAYLAWTSRAVERALKKILPPPEQEPASLHRAMRYSVLAGGKRLRPALVLAGCELAGGSWAEALPAAAAIEMIHTYSLIHDDLPAMDDDDLRRGQPSCHKAFGEAMAILAGDALVTLAFETILARVHPARVAVRIAGEIARAIGTSGMIGGQVRDIEAEGAPPTRPLVERIHREKTGALIVASLRVGGILGGADERTLGVLTAYGESLGLAFQIADDVLDVTSSAKVLGKSAKKDIARGKVTYPAAVGLPAARRAARAAAARAREALESFGARGAILRELAGFAVERAS